MKSRDCRREGKGRLEEKGNIGEEEAVQWRRKNGRGGRSGKGRRKD